MHTVIWDDCQTLITIIRKNSPAHHLVSKKNPTHFRIFILSLIHDSLKQNENYFRTVITMVYVYINGVFHNTSLNDRLLMSNLVLK